MLQYLLFPPIHTCTYKVALHGYFFHIISYYNIFHNSNQKCAHIKHLFLLFILKPAYKATDTLKQWITCKTLFTALHFEILPFKCNSNHKVKWRLMTWLRGQIRKQYIRSLAFHLVTTKDKWCNCIFGMWAKGVDKNLIWKQQWKHEPYAETKTSCWQMCV